MICHDDLHLFTLLTLSSFGCYFYTSTNLHKRTCTFIKLHKYPYFHNFAKFSHNLIHTKHSSYWLALFYTKGVTLHQSESPAFSDRTANSVSRGLLMTTVQVLRRGVAILSYPYASCSISWGGGDERAMISMVR
jgi:hypothetical protein